MTRKQRQAFKGIINHSRLAAMVLLSHAKGSSCIHELDWLESTGNALLKQANEALAVLVESADDDKECNHAD